MSDRFAFTRAASVAMISLSLAGCSGVVSAIGTNSPEPVRTLDSPRSPPASPSTTPVPTAPTDTDPPVEPDESIPIEETEAPGETPEPLVAGQVLGSAEDLARLSQHGLGYYYLADAGFSIATDPSSELPPEVSHDIQRRLDTIGVDISGDNGSAAMDQFSREQALAYDVSTTGKNLITVRLRYMAVPYEDRLPGGYRWVASSVVSGWWMQWDRSRDVVIDNARQWVSENDTDNRWVVFAGPGDAVSPSP